MKEKVEKILIKYSHARRDSLIPILQEIQDDIGYLSEEAIELLSTHLNLASSKIYGLATFYNQFRFQPKGKCHIQVCHGTSCHLMGAITIAEQIEKVLKVKVGQTTRNGNFSLEEVPCMGACAHAPVIQVNGKYYSYLTEISLKELLDELLDTYQNTNN
jgi:NADH-quinone oxidoreductase subunit E